MFLFSNRKKNEIKQIIRRNFTFRRIIRIIIVILSVFFILHICDMAFSDEIDRAKKAIKTSVISNIYAKIMESGFGIVGYRSVKAKNAYPFPINLASNYYYVHDYLSSGMPQYRADMNNGESRIANQENSGKIGKIDFNNELIGVLSREYILTNGAILNEGEYKEYIEAGALNYQIQELPVKILDGAIDYNEFNFKMEGDGGTVKTMRTYNGTPFTLEQLNDVGFLLRHFYIVDSATRVTDELFDAKVLLDKDMTIKTQSDKPQILIYHTHSQEAFLDSREGVKEDTVVGIGDLLAEILEEKYGYNVIHDKSVYDFVDGKLDRNKAYNLARESVSKILEENPSIEVIIDLHRDGADKRSTYINGEETAQIMLLNGLSRNQYGPITRLDNPNLQDNLAFSLQLQLKSLELYPGLFFKNYLQDYRYNLDLRPKSLLVELGTHKNTLKSAKNAMEPFAEILDAVLSGN